MTASRVRAHQEEGAQRLAAAKKLLLGDVPGLGKTRTAVRALEIAGSVRPLIVCPAIVRTHWRREFDVMGWLDDPIIMSYDGLVRGGESLMAKLILREKVDAIVADEVHYCKHAGSQRTQLVLGPDGYAKRLPIVFPASGTPIPKHAGEIWTLLASVFPEVCREHGLRTYSEYLNRFCVWRNVAGRPKVVKLRAENVAELRAILARVMVRRKIEDVGMSLPKLSFTPSLVDAGKVSALLDLERSPELAAFGRALEGAADEADFRALLEAAMQDEYLATYRRLVGEAKAPAVAEQILTELDGTDEKLVVFAHHKSVLARLRDDLAPLGVAYVDGDVPDRRRAKAIDDFQTGAPRIFLGQTIACQTGITLTRAYRVRLVEPDWSAVVNLQAGYRVARIGQEQRMCVAQMSALAGTLDEAIVRQHAREAEMAEQVLG